MIRQTELSDYEMLNLYCLPGKDIYHQVHISFVGINGVLALSCIVVNDCLLLVARFNECKKILVNAHDTIAGSCILV